MQTLKECVNATYPFNEEFRKYISLYTSKSKTWSKFHNHSSKFKTIEWPPEINMTIRKIQIHIKTPVVPPSAFKHHCTVTSRSEIIILISSGKHHAVVTETYVRCNEGVHCCTTMAVDMKLVSIFIVVNSELGIPCKPPHVIKIFQINN